MLMIISSVNPLARFFRKWQIGMGCLLLGAVPLWGADLPGARDFPGLKRFAGSEIVGFGTKNFDQLELQTSTYRTYDVAARRRHFAQPPLKLEGRTTILWYESAGSTSAVELQRNYCNELQSRGFQSLYDSSRDPAVRLWNNFLARFGGMEVQTSRSKYIFMAAEESKAQVLSAKLGRPEGDLYVAVTAVEWLKDQPTYKARRGAYVSVELVEVQPLTQNMVTVSAEQMRQSIASTGRVALYGIYFDTNKADLKPESRNALEEISQLLKKDPALKLHVVGHTDNAGALSFNLDLSKRRSDAVVSALVRDFGISAARLTSHGVASLAPTAVNTTEEGRARNRRVELVPQ